MFKNKSSELVSRFKQLWTDINLCPDDDFSNWTTSQLDRLSEMDTSEDESLAELLSSLKTLDISNRAKFTRQAKSLMKKYLTEYVSLENEELLCEISDAYKNHKDMNISIGKVSCKFKHSLERNEQVYRMANLKINWGHDCREEYRAASDAIERDAAKLVVLDNLVVMIDQSNRSRVNITDIGIMLMTLEWGNLITLEQKRKCVRLLLSEWKGRNDGVVV